jgi:thiol-disulfide isomerase/thioredoxin
MKNTMVVSVCLLMAGVLQAQGIQFTNGTWKEVLAEAGRQNKIVFVDAYTTWCGPCKMMDRNTFTNKEVGDFYNANFVNVKIDMEKGEGPAIAQQYGVRAYPSFLFVDADGELVHRALGYQESAAFVSVGKSAADPERRISGLQKRYDAGDRDPAFLLRFVEMKAAMMDGSHLKPAQEYLKTQKDWSTEKNMEFIAEYADDVDSPMFDYIFKNRAAFEGAFGEAEIRGKIQNAAFQKIIKQGDMELPELVGRMNAFFQEKTPDIANRLGAETAMLIYKAMGDMEGYAKASVAYYSQYPSDDYLELNELAWTFYENVDDKDQLRTALDWALKSVNLTSEYMNNDTVAALYYKLGNKKMGNKYAKAAIKLAMKSGEDFSGTTSLMQQYKGKK